MSSKTQKERMPVRQVRLLINGREVDAENGATFQRIDPVSGEVASVAAAATVADARSAVEAAAAAFPAWAALGPSERRARLQKAADLLVSRTEDFIHTVTCETGATAPWAGFNVHLAAGMLREAAR